MTRYKQNYFKLMLFEIQLPFASTEFQTAWQEWLKFRTESGINSYPPFKLRMAFTQLLKYSEGDECTAIAIIDQSIRLGFAGRGFTPIKDNLTGRTFGKFKVVGFSYNKKNSRIWQCKCECGNISYLSASRLNNGDAYSCGCTSRHIKHGQINHPLYSVWNHMRKRCDKPNNVEYKNYGARGIKVCDEWTTDFGAFFTWSMSNGYSKGLQLDREDNDGNYSPGNCRYVTPKVNSNNKRNNVKITFNGFTYSIEEWSKVTGINPATIRTRLFYKLPIEKVLNPTKCKRLISHQ